MSDYNRDEINSLIAACLAGTAPSEELERLDAWISESKENRIYYQQMKNIRDVWHPDIRLHEVNVEEAYLKVRNKLGLLRRTSVAFTFFLRAAAILFLPLLAGSYYLGTLRNGGQSDKSGQVYNEISAAFGTRSMLTLADGSRVWLNSGSKVKYPKDFSGRNREVFLTGEGYFEVESDASRPFIVQTARLNVRATGTRFNVNVSSLEKASQVTLVEGKVTVSKNLDGGESMEISRMNPRQHLAYDTLSGCFNVLTEDTYKFIAWKDGKLIFRNEPLEDVVKKIGYFYNVSIELKDEKLKEYRYRATFEEESLEEILNLLKMSSPVDYREIRRKPLPDGSFPKKRIIIFPAGKK
jgi:ferric-dicitrate binding protein FerR (iron transport regulator)